MRGVHLSCQAFHHITAETNAEIRTRSTDVENARESLTAAGRGGRVPGTTAGNQREDPPGESGELTLGGSPSTVQLGYTDTESAPEFTAPLGPLAPLGRGIWTPPRAPEMWPGGGGCARLKLAPVRVAPHTTSPANTTAALMGENLVSSFFGDKHFCQSNFNSVNVAPRRGQEGWGGTIMYCLTPVNRQREVCQDESAMGDDTTDLTTELTNDFTYEEDPTCRLRPNVAESTHTHTAAHYPLYICASVYYVATSKYFWSEC
jgi:hypothetical protein